MKNNNFPALQTFVSQYLHDMTTKPYCWSQLVIGSSTWLMHHIWSGTCVSALWNTLLIHSFWSVISWLQNFSLFFYSAFMSPNFFSLKADQICVRFAPFFFLSSFPLIFLCYYWLWFFLSAFFHYKCTKENFPWWCWPSHSGLPTRPNDLWGSYHSGSSLSDYIPRTPQGMFQACQG